MQVQYMCLGVVQTNCYFLLNEETHQLLIVDPADNAGAIIRMVERMQGEPVAILLTHGHFDHILACKEIAEKYKIPVIACKQEEALLADANLNLSAQLGGRGRTLTADVLVEDGEEPEVPGFHFKVLHTPGHTQGSCCYYFPEDKVLISGDTLFCGSCGRTDFPGGSYEDMQKSLQRLINELPEDTKVYPGHDRSTTIRDEKRFNPFV